MARNLISDWVHEDASSRRYHPNKTEAARVATLLSGRAMWSAWKLSGEEARGQAENAQEARDAADAFLGIKKSSP